VYDGREVCEQFPGGGIFGGPGFGFGGIASGSGGFAGGFAGVPGVGVTGIGTLLTLESAFGVGFRAQDIQDAIQRAEQEGRFEGVQTEQGQPTIILATGPDLTLVLNTARGLFEIFRRSDGAKVGGGPSPEAAIRAVEAGSVRPGAGTTFLQPAPSEPIPGPAEGGDFGDLLRTILGALGQLRGDRVRPTGLEPVAIGGTVNVPVVPGSTSDPRGTLRPTESAFVPKPPPPPPRTPPRPTATQASLNIARVALQILLELRRRRFIQDAQRRQRELIAATAALRRQQVMPFGQAGFSAAGIGTAIATGVGAFGATALEALIARLTREEEVAASVPQFPQLPTQLPGQQAAFPVAPGIPGLQGGGRFRVP